MFVVTHEIHLGRDAPPLSCLTFLRCEVGRFGCRNRSSFRNDALAGLREGDGRSAIGDVHGETAERGFLVFIAHVSAGLAHGFDAGVEWHKMRAVTTQGQ